MIDFTPTDDQRLLRQAIRDYARRELGGPAAERDARGALPAALLPSLGQLGVLGLSVPESEGGALGAGTAGTAELAIAVEELARADASVALTVVVHDALCAAHLARAGTEAQRHRLLPALASGEGLGAWAADPARVTLVRAARRAGGWVLHGGAPRVVNGAGAAVCVLLATDETGAPRTFVLEPAALRGIAVEREASRLGVRAADVATLAFDGVEVPDEARSGDAGLEVAGAVLDRARVALAALSLGIGEGALESARAYAKERVQFGRPIAEHQAIQFMLADARTQLDAARMLVEHAASVADAGDAAGASLPGAAARAKLHAARSALRVSDLALQVHGGYGYTRDFPVERALRDAKRGELAEGSSEELRATIARELLHG